MISNGVNWAGINPNPQADFRGKKFGFCSRQTNFFTSKIMKKVNFNNQGQSLIGIIIALVMIGLVSSGSYFYLERPSEKKIGIQEEEKNVPKQIKVIEEKEDKIEEIKIIKENKIEDLVKKPIIPDREVFVKQNETLNIVNRILGWGHRIPSTPRLIDTIIIHSSYNAWGDNFHSVDGMIDIYEFYGVANHYLIARDGTIYRLVYDKNIAFHAGVSKMPDNRINVNTFSIGVTLIYRKIEKPNKIQYQSLVNLIKYLKEKYDIPMANILGHAYISPNRKTDPWNFDCKNLMKC